MNEWKILGPGGKVYKVLDRVADMLIWNFLWIVCSLPILTIGASTCALYHVNTKKIRKEDVGIGEFFVVFKENLLFGISYQLVIICATLFTVWGIIMTKSSPVSIVFYTLLFICSAVGSFVFPTRVCFMGTWKNILKISMFLAIKRPLYFVFKIVLGTFYAIAVYVLQRYYITGLLPILLLFGASVGNWVCQYLYLKSLNKLNFVKSTKLIEDEKVT